MHDIHHVLTVDEVDVDAILPLRTRVLRPHFDEGELARWPLDDEPTTHHFAAIDTDSGEVVGCVTFQLAGLPDEPSEWGDVQLRGMAVSQTLQGQGVGARLLDGSLPRLALLYPDARRIWCNARERAVSFYARAGFVVIGEAFEIPEIGPHRRMWRKLPPLLA
jgi:predicted GNAT family N-acyltransferase